MTSRSKRNVIWRHTRVHIINREFAFTILSLLPQWHCVNVEHNFLLLPNNRCKSLHSEKRVPKISRRSNYSTSRVPSSGPRWLCDSFPCNTPATRILPPRSTPPHPVTPPRAKMFDPNVWTFCRALQHFKNIGESTRAWRWWVDSHNTCHWTSGSEREMSAKRHYSISISSKAVRVWSVSRIFMTRTSYARTSWRGQNVIWLWTS